MPPSLYRNIIFDEKMSCKSKQKGIRQKGWLNKRGGRIHTWHKRWFVLNGDLLFYYKSPQDSRPTGTIPLAGNKIIRHPDDHKQPSYKFEIVAGNEGQVIASNHDSYLISADLAEVADSWVAALRRVVHEPYGGGMFGRSLEETMQVEARLGGNYVPILVHRCVKFIREHGLHEVGIFRLPGQASRIQLLKELYDSGCQQDFSKTDDVHTIASLFKLYFRELPEPVVPFLLYESCKEALEVYFSMENRKSTASTEGDGLEQLKRLLIQLPIANLNVLKYLSRFLHEVDECSQENKMNLLNLGTIFGSHLLRPETDDPHVLMECNNVSTNFVRGIVSNHLELFPLTNDEHTPKRLSIVFQAGATPPWLQKSNRGNTSPLKMVQRSFYQPKSHNLSFRQRQNSAPPDHKRKFGGKVASVVEQFNSLKGSKNGEPYRLNRNVEITAPVQNFIPNKRTIQVSTEEKKLSKSPEIVHQHSDESFWKNNPLFASNEADSDSDDDVPEIIKRLSLNGIPSGRQLSETLSSDMIVNSISNELETLECQLSVSREEVLCFKKSARLWKSRYELEHRARIAAEQRIHDLQNLIDETFQQFALDDSEDEFDDDDSPSTIQDTMSSFNYSQPVLNMSPMDSRVLSPLKQYSSSPALTSTKYN